MGRIQGKSVAPGLALGPVHVVRAAKNEVPTWTVPAEEVAREVERLHAALAAADEVLGRQEELVRRKSGDQDAGIFAVHRMILQDPAALKQVEERIVEQRINGEAAIEALVQRLHSTMSGMDGEVVRSMAADVADPWRLAQGILSKRESEAFVASGELVILAAQELTPQVATFLDPDRVLAIVTEAGGRYSHGAVLARSFGFPCVVGLQNLLSRLEQGMQVLVDADAGWVQLEPTSDEIDHFLERRKRRSSRDRALRIGADQPAVTSDGKRLGVQINIESVRDIDRLDVGEIEGVGLLRTEFLYMERSEFPSEEEQYRLYRRILERMQGRPVTLRTLDIGGDKQLAYFQTPKEVNPALGWRGLRISLEWQDLFAVQLRAALRASVHGQLRILLPMVTSIHEVEEVHRIFDRVRHQLFEQGYSVAEDVPVGVMVEVPSAVICLRELLAETDFVSVGTNDLVQYLLAVDRDNPWVAELYDPYHPAVIRSLAEIADVAREVDKPATVCGEMAGDEAVALLLLGLGYTAISAAPNFVPAVKYAVRGSTYVEACELAQRLRSMSHPADIHKALEEVRARLHRAVESAE